MSKAKIYSEDYANGIAIDFDPSKYKTAVGAGKAFYKALKKLNAALGGPEGEVFMREAGEGYAGGVVPKGAVWVCWESGPYYWGVSTSLSNTGYNRSAGWWTEPHYPFDLMFYPN